jgi:Tannase and feruloyl esterase
MKICSSSLLVTFFLVIERFTLPARAGDCEGLSRSKLAGTTIAIAQAVPAGRFTPPYGSAIDSVASFCRVAGVIEPSSDSYIRFEVWLPENWNGKYLGVGNGGFAGSIGYKALANNLNHGYATAATDTGHQAEGEDASWAFRHPEKIVDFGYRALHLTTINAKSLMKEFYKRSPQHSYFSSCSDGGREALMEAQRFPADFDGILAGAPANFWTHMLAGGVNTAQALVGNPAGYISSLKMAAITKAALEACDAQDGVKDGIINNPFRCRFDPSVMLCKGVDSLTCLTAPQVAALERVYAGGRNSSGQRIFPGLIPGGEGGWGLWVTGLAPGGSLGYMYVQNYFRYMVFDDPGWDLIHASVDEAEQAADEKTAHALNATDPNLHSLQARGGKLILYHGWNDAAISPINTINYYESVLRTMGGVATSGFVRLYMVPGMAHCSSGPGPNSFGQSGPGPADGPQESIFSALEDWVEKGTAPTQIIAKKYVDDNSSKGVAMTRPLCSYPQIAKYKGSGNTNNASSFVCAAGPE